MWNVRASARFLKMREPSCISAVSNTETHEEERTMHSRLPPIPDENRSPKGPGEPATADAGSERGNDPTTVNFDKQGHQGNSKVNTTHQGYQQDR
jgi:hypothetical protein